MSINNINNYTQTYNARNGSTATTDKTDTSKTEETKKKPTGLVDTDNLRKPSNELGQDAFMKILIAQLANQDPMEPMKDTDFIAQMAQFSSLEQMQNLNQSFINNQAYSMIGKSIIAETYIKNTDGQFEKKVVYGPVSGVENVQGKTYLVLGDYLIDPASVSQVYEVPNIGNEMMQGGMLVGKYVTGTIKDKDGKEDITVNGKVTEIAVKKDGIYAIVDGKEVNISTISSIRDTPESGVKPEDPPKKEEKPPTTGGAGSDNSDKVE